MRVLVLSGETRLCLALKRALSRETQLSCVSEPIAAEGYLAQVDAAQPDLVLVDWDLPGHESPLLLSALHALEPHPKIVAFSQDGAARRQALGAGADAFLCRDEPLEQLLITLHRVAGLSPYSAN
jgi:DNA-binding NarL/FixJ family response regulator